MQPAVELQDVTMLESKTAATAPEMAAPVADVFSDDDAEPQQDRDDDEYVQEDNVDDDPDASFDDGSDPGPLSSTSNSDNSDDVSEGGRGKKRRKQQRRKEEKRRLREDNLMTRKLRSAPFYEDAAGPQDSQKEKQGVSLKTAGRSLTRSGNDSANDLAAAGSREDLQDGSRSVLSGTDSENGEEEVGAEHVELERQISEEQAREDLAIVSGMWEWAAICEFLYLFRYQLELKTVFTMHSLADALVRSPGVCCMGVAGGSCVVTAHND